jgi:hypothetical protein
MQLEREESDSQSATSALCPLLEAAYLLDMANRVTPYHERAPVRQCAVMSSCQSCSRHAGSTPPDMRRWQPLSPLCALGSRWKSESREMVAPTGGPWWLSTNGDCAAV